MQYLVVSPLGESFQSSNNIDDLSKEIERKLGYKVSQQHLTIDSVNTSLRRRGTNNSTDAFASNPTVTEEPPVKVFVNPNWYPSFMICYLALMRSIFDIIFMESKKRSEHVKKLHLRLSNCHPLVNKMVTEVVIPFISNFLLVSFGACLMGVCAQITIPLPASISTVPITGQTFGVMWLGSLTGFIIAPLSILLYLFCGSVLNIPWFTNQSYGTQILFQSSTSGFLVGFFFSALVCGWFCSKLASDRTIMMNLLMLCLSNSITFICGCAWLAFGTANLGLSKAIEKGLAPFLPGETIKIVLVLIMVRFSWFILFRIRHAVLNHLNTLHQIDQSETSNMSVEEGNNQQQFDQQIITSVELDEDDNRCLSTCSNSTNYGTVLN